MLATTLIICVAGLYGSFITWSILQEKINTTPYGDNELFKAPLIINIIQSFFAILISFTYSKIKDNTNPFAIFKNEKQVSRNYFKMFLITSLTSSISSPIAYKSLNHVDYLVYLLSKSCKLIPIMIVHGVIYRTRFPMYKIMVAGCVTLGVLVFTLSNSTKKKSNNDGDTILGIFQLGSSMILDGLTNSTQDQLFKYQKTLDKKVTKVNGIILMCILNTFMMILTIIYTLLFKYDEEVVSAISFAQRHPQVLMDILTFGIFGSVGQIFVFIILEKFDSIILTTATVTRKMLSMITSVLLFGHALNFQQIMGVALVFLGIGYEALIKIKPKGTPDPKTMAKKDQ